MFYFLIKTILLTACSITG